MRRSAAILAAVVGLLLASAVGGRAEPRSACIGPSKPSVVRLAGRLPDGRPVCLTASPEPDPSGTSRNPVLALALVRDDGSVVPLPAPPRELWSIFCRRVTAFHVIRIRRLDPPRLVVMGRCQAGNAELSQPLVYALRDGAPVFDEVTSRKASGRSGLPAVRRIIDREAAGH